MKVQTNESSAPQLTDGESVVFVPLIGTSGKNAVGLLEIHGLVLPGITDFEKFKRPEGMIRAMIENKDYKFMKHTKLWRRPMDRSGGVLPKKIAQNDHKYNEGCYPVVCGKATEANESLNGVPYFGGARYTVLWEDGLQETAIPPQEFINVSRKQVLPFMMNTLSTLVIS